VPPWLRIILLTAGLAGAARLLAPLARGRFDGPPMLAAAAVLSALALAVPLPAALGDRLWGLDQQRRAGAGVIERTAREKCMLDFGRSDLVGFVEFVKRQMPPDATFALKPAGMLPCLSLNLAPRTPTYGERADPRRDWLIYDREVPDEVRRAAGRERSLPEPQRHYLEFSGSFVLVRPTAGPT
jgi:hypothetical protein